MVNKDPCTIRTILRCGEGQLSWDPHTHGCTRGDHVRHIRGSMGGRSTDFGRARCWWFTPHSHVHIHGPCEYPETLDHRASRKPYGRSSGIIMNGLVLSPDVLVLEVVVRPSPLPGDRGTSGRVDRHFTLLLFWALL